MNELPSASPLGRFLTPADTAETLNVSVGQVYDLIRSGELPAIRVGNGRTWRIERSVLESYIEAKYEEARRMSLWNESDLGSVAELAAGRDWGRHTRTTTI